ncbi:uncharacterized protein [Haliotis asinina]
MNTWGKAAVVCILIFNIAVGIAAVCLMLTSQNFKTTLDQVYREALANGHGKTKDKTNDVGPMNISLQMVNLLKPIAFLTGLDDTGLVDDGHYRVTPVRGWAAQTMVGSERQVLYNGMQNDHGSISVPAAGVYMVYSHVIFQINEDCDVLHRITRYNAGKQEENIVFLDVVSGNRHDVEQGVLVSASVIRGILQLNAGDQLRVDISGVLQSDYEKDWSYFGLYKI